MSVTGAFIVPHPPIILPEVGRGEEKKIINTDKAYREVARRVASLKPETIVLTSPHAVAYADYFHISPGAHAKGNLAQFGVPDVFVEADYDQEFVQALAQTADEAGVPAGTLGERDPALDHGTLIPLRYINAQFQDYQLVRVGLSGLLPVDHYRLGKCIAATAEKLNRSVVFIASGDLSHKLTQDGPYGFVPEGPAFDSRITDYMKNADFLQMLMLDEKFCDKAAECGLRSFQIMAGALDKTAVRAQLLSYEGPFGVGYGVAAFEPAGADDSRCFDVLITRQERERAAKLREGQDAYVRLARLSLETYIKTGKKAALPKELEKDLINKRAGVFVSLKKHGRLRGCIGTIQPVKDSVAEEILSNAISAGCEDPRFDPVTVAELDDLIYSVDVLGEPERIDSPESLDVKRYGVIVTNGSRRGLLLPNLEGVDTVEQQIAISRQKAGIPAGEPVMLERFEVVRHK